MSVKWIKITTDIFDDEKIKIIDTMPARDEILVIWFKLLALTGKVNRSGMLFLSDKIPYTTEMLSAVFNRDVNSVKFALKTFSQFGMIEIEDNEVISITNWEKHQNVDGLDKIREQNRIRQKKHRDKQKLLVSNVTDNVTVTEDNALEEELEKDKEINNKPTLPKWSEESIEYRLSLFLYNHILKNNPNHKKPNLQSWSEHTDKMIRLDHRPVEEIKAVIKFATEDNFWKSNILSTKKLREKYDQLVIRKNSGNKIPKHNQVNDRMTSESDLMAKLRKKNPMI